MVRVLHINSNINVQSGVMSVIMNYYKNINRKCIQFDFLYYTPKTSDVPTNENMIKSLGGKVFFVKKNILMFYKIKQFLREHRGEYQVLHLHDAFLARFIYNSAKKNGIRLFITHAHATYWSDYFMNSVRNRLLCLNLSKYTDVCFACSNLAGNFMYGKNVNFYVINNAIDTSKYSFDYDLRIKLREKYNLKEKFVLGHVGRMVYPKNPFFMLDVLKEVKKQVSNVVLVYVGDGVLEKEIICHMKKLNLEDNVLFLGNCQNANELYNLMDVFLLPSLYEGLPVVGVEAQCNSLPIVMSQNITDEVGIFQYKYVDLKKDARYWSNILIDLAKNSVRDKETALLTIRGRGFDIAVEGKKLESLYNKLLEVD